MKNFSDLDLTKTYSYADYLTWAFDEMVELIKGRIFKMSPAPTAPHQRLVGNIHGLIWQYLRKKNCEVFIAPFDVRLLNKDKSTADKDIFTVVQPDICVVCDPAKIENRGCIGAPDLIIEVASPATIRQDIDTKYKLYEEQEVTEYWIVLPKDQTVSIFDLDTNTKKYVLRGIYSRHHTVTVGVLKDLNIDLSEVFPEPEL